MALTRKYNSKNIINSSTLISGIYQPQITKHISLNNIINISKQTIELTDVYKHTIIQNTKFLIIVGNNEPKAWKELTINYCKWLLNKNISFTFYNAINLNHFSIIKDLANQNSSLSQKVMKMCEI